MSQRNTRQRWVFWGQIVLGLVLGLAALYLAIREVDWRQLWRVLLGVRLPLVALTLVSALLTPLVKAIRWRWLFYPHQARLSLARMTGLVAVGQAVNLLLLGRWGDLARVYLTGEEAQLSKSYVLGTVAAEKLLEVVVLALLVLALVPLIALPSWLSARVGYLLLVALVVSAAAAVLLGGRRFWLRIAGRLLDILPRPAAERWQTRLAAALEGLAVLGDRRAAAAIWGWTALTWALSAATNLLLLLAFDLSADLRIAFFLLIVLQAGVAVPSAPGKLGVFQYLCVLGLSVFAIPATAAFGYGLVLYLLVVGSICAWAAAGLWQGSMSVRRLAQVSAGWRAEGTQDDR